MDFRLALHKFDLIKNLCVHLLVLKKYNEIKNIYVCFLFTNIGSVRRKYTRLHLPPATIVVRCTLAAYY